MAKSKKTFVEPVLDKPSELEIDYVKVLAHFQSIGIQGTLSNEGFAYHLRLGSGMDIKDVSTYRQIMVDLGFIKIDYDGIIFLRYS